MKVRLFPLFLALEQSFPPRHPSVPLLLLAPYRAEEATVKLLRFLPPSHPSLLARYYLTTGATSSPSFAIVHSVVTARRKRRESAEYKYKRLPVPARKGGKGEAATFLHQ